MSTRLNNKQAKIHPGRFNFGYLHNFGEIFFLNAGCPGRRQCYGYGEYSTGKSVCSVFFFRMNDLVCRLVVVGS